MTVFDRIRGDYDLTPAQADVLTREARDWLADCGLRGTPGILDTWHYIQSVYDGGAAQFVVETTRFPL